MNLTQAYSIIARTLQAGGGTFQNGRDITDDLKTGFVVGGVIKTSIKPVDAFYAIVDKLLVLSHNHDLIGTWLHDDNVYIDVVNVIEDRDEAIKLGKERGEIAIWDVANSTEVVVQ